MLCQYRQWVHTQIEIENLIQGPELPVSDLLISSQLNHYLAMTHHTRSHCTVHRELPEQCLL